MENQNRKRGLEDVVGVEAWHASFDESARIAELHIDVVFQTGRLGGHPKDRVRFKLGLKKAQVVLVISPGEPVSVDIRSVVRDAPIASGEHTQTASSAQKAGVNAKLNASAGMKPELSGLLNVDATVSGERENSVQITEPITQTKVVHIKTSDDFHRWIVSPTMSSSLDGRPWDSKIPRLKLIDTRGNQANYLAPTVRVEVRCMMEDLEITDISLKDGNLWDRLTAATNHRNRLAAAEAFIRTRLSRDGLTRTDLTQEVDRYAEITIATTIAES